MKTPIICLMGPTAAGKTDLALQIATNLPVEIISVDSGMIYRGMNIGTAKPNAAELKLVKHHLIDICDPSESYSAAQFRQDALTLIDTIFKANKIPLLVGGTMLYFKVLLFGISPLPSADPIIRNKIMEEAFELGWKKMHDKLRVIDPVAAARIKPSDSQRISRALEIFEITGKNMTELCEKFPPKPLDFPSIKFSLMPTDRSILDERILKRFKLMLSQGFVEEVEALFKRGDLNSNMPSMRSVGYRQVWNYLAGEIDFATMQQQILIATHQLAKRQITWLKSLPDIICFDSENHQLQEKIMQCIMPKV